MYEATQTISRTTQAPLGLVWIKDTQHVLSLGLEKALGAEARVHTGYKGPKAQTPSAVIYLQEDLDGEEELAQEIESIRAQAPHATILVCAPAPDLRLARGALKAGASGLIHIGMPPQQILRALYAARRGEVVLPRVLLRLWVDEQQRLLEPRIDLCSARQRKVLELVVEGLTNAEIAGRLFLSESTIKQHLRAAYKALGVKKRTEAAAVLRRCHGGTHRQGRDSDPRLRNTANKPERWGSRTSKTHTERSTSMARERPTNLWECDHHYPIEVVAVGGGKRARCLGCGACGPVRAAGEDAMLALRAEARHRGKVGA
jgi:DNA-binding NarL/FixJ family response regulator